MIRHPYCKHTIMAVRGWSTSGSTLRQRWTASRIAATISRGLAPPSVCCLYSSGNVSSLCTGLPSLRRGCKHTLQRPGCRVSRKLVVAPKAMVNVDFASPSLVLGAMLIGCGVVLLQMRNMQTRVSRDADIVVAAMVSIVGSTLIFQGWRLDPLLLLCQALTTSVAVWYGIETFRLRSKEEEAQNTLLPPPDGSWHPPGLDMQQQQLPPFSQQQQQQAGAQGFMGMFSRPTNAQQQQGVAGSTPVVDSQSLGNVPGGYLPPAQDQTYYSWTDSPTQMQYSNTMAPQEMQQQPQLQYPSEQGFSNTWGQSPEGYDYDPSWQQPQQQSGTSYSQGSQQMYASGGYYDTDGSMQGYSAYGMAGYMHEQNSQGTYDASMSQQGFAVQAVEQRAPVRGDVASSRPAAAPPSQAPAPAQITAGNSTPVPTGIMSQRIAEHVDDWE